jgi:hypothetical protein
LPQQWKESITVPIYESDKTDCSNYRGISLLSTIYKILFNILLARLTPYVSGIFGDHVGSIIINVPPIRFPTFATYYKKWNYNGTLHQLFIEFKKAHVSVTREILYNILLKFDINNEQVRLIKKPVAKSV